MKRLVVIGAAMVALAVGGSAAAASAPASHAKVRDFVCQRALDPPGRAVSVEAVMRPVSETKRMALRFELLARAKRGGSWTEVTGGDLGKWVYPTDPPTLGQRSGDVWKFNHPVADLAAPDYYRFSVTFKWIGAHSHTLATAVRLSPTCYQPELRPDLFVGAIRVTPTTDAKGNPMDQYTAVIGNQGATAAGMFDLQFTDGTVVRDRTVNGLGPHHTIKETFVGPTCTAGAVTITADPSGLIDDSNRNNNSMTAACPA